MDNYPDNRDEEIAPTEPPRPGEQSSTPPTDPPPNSPGETAPMNPSAYGLAWFRAIEGEVLEDRYQVETLLGKGAMGAVFRATQVRLRRTVAIKIPHPQIAEIPEFLQRFEREALTMAKLVHENIVQIIDVCVHQQSSSPSFIVMEFVEGQTLEKFLREEAQNLSLSDMMDVFHGAAKGIDAAHEYGVVHRDIKPDNIVVTMPRHIPKIMDFGIARVDMEDVFQTMDPSMMGTPAYMAPEQALGRRATKAADIYSFGMMLYRLLSGGFAFNVQSATEFVRAQAEYIPIPIHDRNPRLPEGLWPALAPALAKKPEDRPESAVAVVESVARVLDPVGEHLYSELFENDESSPLTPVSLTAATREAGQRKTDTTKDTIPVASALETPATVNRSVPQGPATESAMGTTPVPSPKKSHSIWLAVAGFLAAVVLFAAVIIGMQLGQRNTPQQAVNNPSAVPISSNTPPANKSSVSAPTPTPVGAMTRNGGSGNLNQQQLFETIAAVERQAAPLMGQVHAAAQSQLVPWYFFPEPVPLGLDVLATSDLKVIVLDPTRDGSEQSAYSQAQIRKLQDAGKRVFAIVDIAHADPRRWYHRQMKDPQPPWLGPVNNDGDGTIHEVRYWDRQWRDILVGTRTGDSASQIDRVINTGYDGVYLSGIDAYNYWSGSAAEISREKSREYMLATVVGIRTYVEDFRKKPDFLLMGQVNDFVLNDQNQLDSIGKRYAAQLDALLVIDVFFQPAGAPSTAAQTNALTQILSQVRGIGGVNRPVFVAERILDPNLGWNGRNLHASNHIQGLSIGQDFEPALLPQSGPVNAYLDLPAFDLSVLPGPGGLRGPAGGVPPRPGIRQ